VILKTLHAATLAKVLKKQKWVDKAKVSDDHVHISLKKAETRIPDLIKLAAKHKVVIKSVEMHKPTLEDVFIRLTGRKIRDESADSKEAMRLEMRMHGGR